LNEWACKCGKPVTLLTEQEREGPDWSLLLCRISPSGIVQIEAELTDSQRTSGFSDRVRLEK
jgi:hypothetical protein